MKIKLKHMVWYFFFNFQVPNREIEHFLHLIIYLFICEDEN